jgi:threonine/homoserine/homoserine lactone efflux protein
MSVLLKGFILGFSIAAPVGPIGVLCIRRTLAQGRWVGFLSGLGAATADALYGCVAAFGLVVISNFLVEQAFWLRLIGGGFLVYLGITTLLAKAKDMASEQRTVEGASAYASTFILTLTNPMTIIAFSGMFMGMGFVATDANWSGAVLMTLGVFVGSAAWWLILSAGVGAFKDRLTSKGLRAINVLSGLIITAFGVYQLAKVATAD